MPREQFAFLIITYNASDYIENLLDSIVNGNEILVVDNGSVDNTFNILETRNIKYIKNEKNGYAAGINIGLNTLKKKNVNYVFVLNQDTKILDIIYDYELYKKYAVIQPYILNEDMTIGVDELKMNILGFIFPFRYKQNPYYETKDIVFFSGAGFIINMEKYSVLGDFDESYFMYYEDVDYSVICKLAGEKILLYEGIRIIHYYKNSVSSLNKIKQLINSRKIFVNKYFFGLWRTLMLVLNNPKFRKHTSEKNKLIFSKYILNDLFLGFKTKQIFFPVRLFVNIIIVPYGLFLKLFLKIFFLIKTEK